MVEECNEIEIDLDDFADYLEELNYENVVEEEIEAECQEYSSAMRTSLKEHNYHHAFENARELKKRNYLRYKEEIDKCCEECAEHDVLEALIYEADKYTKRGDGKPKSEAFRYLYKLNEIGYIESFRWLADCYYYGIGCEKDLKKQKNYILKELSLEKTGIVISGIFPCSLREKNMTETNYLEFL